MASKAVARASVDWSKIASEVTKADLPKINRLKAQMDATGVKMSSLPASLPQLDWSHYKAHASDPKLVEEIEKRYSALKIEKPQAPAKRLDELQEHHKQDKARLEKFQEVARSYIESAEVVKQNFERMIPVKNMTYEDYFLTFPHWSWSIERPSIAPHYGRAAGLTREEAAALDQPDPLPYATKTAWKDWETKYKKWYE